MSKKKSNLENIIVEKVSHLTVTTYPDGSKNLEWDWNQLLKDVSEAIESLSKSETIEKPVAKRGRKPKNKS